MKRPFSATWSRSAIRKTVRDLAEVVGILTATKTSRCPLRLRRGLPASATRPPIRARLAAMKRNGAHEDHTGRPPSVHRRDLYVKKTYRDGVVRDTGPTRPHGHHRHQRYTARMLGRGACLVQDEFYEGAARVAISSATLGFRAPARWPAEVSPDLLPPLAGLAFFCTRAAWQAGAPA